MGGINGAGELSRFPRVLQRMSRETRLSRSSVLPLSELALEGSKDQTLLGTGSFAFTSMVSGSIIHMDNELHMLKVKN